MYFIFRFVKDKDFGLNKFSSILSSFFFIKFDCLERLLDFVQTMLQNRLILLICFSLARELNSIAFHIVYRVGVINLSNQNAMTIENYLF